MWLTPVDHSEPVTEPYSSVLLNYAVARIERNGTSLGNNCDDVGGSDDEETESEDGEVPEGAPPSDSAVEGEGDDPSAAPEDSGKSGEGDTATE